MHIPNPMHMHMHMHLPLPHSISLSLSHRRQHHHGDHHGDKHDSKHHNSDKPNSNNMNNPNNKPSYCPTLPSLPTTHAFERVNEKADVAVEPYWAAEWDSIKHQYDEITSVPLATRRDRLVQKVRLAKVNRAAKVISKRERIHRRAVEGWKRERMQEIAARSVASRRRNRRPSGCDKVAKDSINVDVKERKGADVPWVRSPERRWTV
ncbi:hypothetical protein QBC34DRAFT_76644 [Podospora aff. communis PSN243]|uniref:Uncharacterized protein n=1 Tax=Podospora aff. communis PSN243 TaxID=3040156 RepID=A0AAV9GS52_9PEZI|nr:hypothetical protein QBC34DRAFT_76644 [Podospora aff. communis PSN243]